MRLSERMKCKHNELIELTICMVGGTESGAGIYDAKICRNRAAFSNSIKPRKVTLFRLADCSIINQDFQASDFFGFSSFQIIDKVRSLVF